VADEAAMRVMLCGVPGTRLSVEGVAVTPAGRPLTVIATGFAKPFEAVAATLITAPVPPPLRLMVAGVAASEKSALALVLGALLLHDVSNTRNGTTTPTIKTRRERMGVTST